MAATQIRSTPLILTTTAISTSATTGYGDVTHTPHRQAAATSHLNRLLGTHRVNPATAHKAKTIHAPMQHHPQGRLRDIGLAPLGPNRPSPS